MELSRAVALVALFACHLAGSEAQTTTAPNVQMRSFEEVYGNALLITVTSLDTRTCNIARGSRVACTDSAGNVVGQGDQTRCTLTYECCYNELESDEATPSCFRTALLSSIQQVGEGEGRIAVLSQTFQGAGVGFPSRVVPGTVGSTGGLTIPIIPAAQVRRRTYNGYIYTYYTFRVTFQEAVLFANAVNEQLLIIDSAAIQSAIEGHLISIGVIGEGVWDGSPWAAGYWVAGSDVAVEGRWVWRDGRQIPLRGQAGYQNWMSLPRQNYYEPTGGLNEDCLYVLAHRNIGVYQDLLAKWFDGPCGSRKYFITRRPVPVDPCTRAPCQNGGICSSEGTAYFCACPTGFVGTNCEIDNRPTDPCLSQPCFNGGLCQSAGNQFACVCAPGYAGSLCQIRTTTAAPTTTQPPPTVQPPRQECCQVSPFARIPCNPPTNAFECSFRRGCCYDSQIGDCFLPLTPSQCAALTAPPPTTRPETKSPQPDETPPRRGWLLWSGWTECSATCGPGTQIKFRGCIGSVPGSQYCPGIAREEISCNEGDCTGWGSWTLWSNCPVTCGGSSRLRTRECVNHGSESNDVACPGAGAETESCGDLPCPTWSQWGSWSSCSATCGGGNTFRTRECQNAIDEFSCVGDARQEMDCNTRNCATWGEWGQYDPCPVTCGGGTQTRSRICLYGSIGDIGCDLIEDATMSIDCAVANCEYWTEWSDYGPCSSSCGSGTQTRTRQCMNGVPGIGACSGLATDTQTCQGVGSCPTWTQWSDYGDCTASCGGGIQSRSRTCQFAESNAECEGPSNQVSACNRRQCESWEPWEPSGDCSATCGGGRQMYTRICSGGSVGMPGCLGNATKYEPCNENECPYWSQWEPFGDCSATCGDGVQLRRRVCRPEPSDASLCGGSSVDSVVCSTGVSCANFTDWSPWSPCSASCGGGTQTRFRECEGGNVGDVGCDGLADDSLPCETQPCPRWSDWAITQECVSCGPGTIIRSRTCTYGQVGDIGCVGDTEMQEQCFIKNCPVWGQWAQWGQCSQSCDDGQRERTRDCQYGDIGEGACTGDRRQVEDCNDGPCAEWSEWSGFTPCSESCGDSGQQFRSRSCKNGEVGQAGCTGSASETVSCNVRLCPVFSPWGEWSSCDKPCGGGEMSRRRSCENGLPGQDGCIGLFLDGAVCNTEICGSWGSWGDFTECNALCDGGTQYRQRTCEIVPGAVGYSCPGEATDEQSCNTHGCPLWGRWGPFSDCSLSCGGGTSTRYRSCENGKDEDCSEGAKSETVACNTQLCPTWAQWTPFSNCTVPCGGGTQRRTRNCDNGVPGDLGCVGMPVETQGCNDQPCPRWGPWSEWSLCSVTCNGAVQLRARECLFGDIGDCDGDAEDVRPCATSPCPYMGDWGEWSPCSATCNFGEQTRNRTCVNGDFGMVGCLGASAESKECDELRPCFSWSPWSPWGRCRDLAGAFVRCGEGRSRRFRTCPGGVIGLRGCEGPNEEFTPCDEGPCPAWDEWSPWSQCTASCGGGFIERYRDCLHGTIGDEGCEEDGGNEILDCNTNRCDCTLLDIGFIIDSSSSIGKTNFETVRSFLRSVIRRLNVGLDLTRVAALRYNKVVHPLWSFAQSTSSEDLIDRINRIVYDGSGTRTGAAITHASSNMFTEAEGDRPDIASLAVVLTDGRAQDEPENTVALLKNLGIRVVAIAVTNLIDKDQINAIASDPDSTYSFFVEDFEGLLSVVENIATFACGKATWGEWGEWSSCGSTCGSSTRTRERVCVGGFGINEGVCPDGEKTQSEACNTSPCPTWTEWTPNDECSVTCGGGVVVRFRRCIFGSPGDIGCEGVDVLNLTCNTQSCPSWTQWETWSPCSRTCGGGESSRKRYCLHGEVGDIGCNGDDQEMRNCSQTICPSWSSWSSWGDCSVSCGLGYYSRQRSCQNGVIGDIGCDSIASERDSCGSELDRCPTWAEWGSWGDCTTTCGGGERSHVRVCLNGDVGDIGCHTGDTEREGCNSMVCPTWTPWSDWSDCSLTCGSGSRYRTRGCQGGKFGQAGCDGDIKLTENCNTQTCPTWSAWGSWGDCSKTCGEGVYTHERVCLNGDVGDMGCDGPTSVENVCQVKPCAFWSQWGEFGDCSATCGGGLKTRERVCVNGQFGDEGCEGPVGLVDTVVCATMVCPAWGPWSSWEECTRSCGGGTTKRTRSCENGVQGQIGCEGYVLDSADCGTEQCPTWTTWGEWSQCTVTCAGGSQKRSRECSGGDLELCLGPSEMTRGCNYYSCPHWSPWARSDPCSATCGGGQRRESRSCVDGDIGQDGCIGDDEKFVDCNSQRCPQWSSWGNYTSCSASCGTGIRIRLRSCVGGLIGSIGCHEGGTEDQVECNTQDCPYWTPWSEFGDCSVTCGSGIYTHTRTCVNGFAGQHGCDGPEEESAPCNAGNCPRWGPWEQWSSCSRTCGGGTLTRSRQCVDGDVGDAGCIGPVTSTAQCNLRECPYWGPWGEWSQCAVTCGGGRVQRRRTCINGEVGESGCEGFDAEEQSCGETTCPSWSQWSDWGTCGATCGGGRRERSRTCNNGEVGQIGCEGVSSERQDCNEQQCPRWDTWSSWSQCTVSCGGGSYQRSRSCSFGSVGQIGCIGLIEQTGDCQQQDCPTWSTWLTWSSCSLSCGGGSRSRSRTCLLLGNVVLGCTGADQEVENCQTQICPSWTSWGQWGQCNVQCGGGRQIRNRFCENGNPGDRGCLGSAEEELACQEQPCSEWTEWGSWGQCSATCGGGSQERTRTCTNGSPGDAGCPGSDTSTQACGNQICPTCSPNYEDIGMESGYVVCTDGMNVGSICTFNCRAGYQIVGMSNLVCEEVAVGVAEWSTTAPTCSRKCSDQVDVVFVLDSSSSIGAGNFRIVRGFVTSLVQRFNVGPEDALFGAIRYNNRIDHLWNLNDFSTKARVLQEIQRIPYDGFGTLTGNAINYTHQFMFTEAAGRRSGVPKIVVVITDGISYDDVEIPSQLLKADNTLVVAVGIGKIDTDQIYEIASDPDTDFATTVDDFNSLTKVVNSITNQIKLCQGIVNVTECPTEPVMDVVFIVDSSSSIGDENFELMRNFIINLIEVFTVSPSTTQVGFLRYNREVDPEFELDTYSTTQGVIDAVRAVQYSGSGTWTGRALSYASTNSFRAFNGRRPGVPGVAIVITDGRAQDDVSGPASALRLAAEVIAIGIQGAVESELREIAGPPPEGTDAQNVYSVNDFAALASLIENISRAVCFAGRGAR